MMRRLSSIRPSTSGCLVAFGAWALPRAGLRSRSHLPSRVPSTGPGIRFYFNVDRDARTQKTPKSGLYSKNCEAGGRLLLLHLATLMKYVSSFSESLFTVRQLSEPTEGTLIWPTRWFSARVQNLSSQALTSVFSQIRILLSGLWAGLEV